MIAVSAPLLTLNLLAGAVWVGSLLTLTVVTRAARETIDVQVRVAFFRALGRRYGVVGGGALAVAIATGAALLSDEPWTGALGVLVVLTSALVAATVAGVTQARRVNRLRERLYRDIATSSSAVAVARQAAVAGLLRAVIGLLTLGIVVDVALYVSNH